MSRGPRETIFDDPLARTASIPLALWVCAAVVAHLFGGGGAMKAAEIAHERDELRAAFRYAREGVHPPDTTFELMTDTSEPVPQATEPPTEDGKTDGKSDEPPDPNAPKPDPSRLDKSQKPDKPPQVEPPKPEEHKVEPPKVAEKPKEPEPLKPLIPLPAAPPPPPPPPPDVDHRQAVKQNVPKNQADNPDAKRVADEANHTDHETVARARAQDQDSPNPSMGASASTAPKGETGNSEDEHSGSAEDHKGNEKHAPGESDRAATDDHHENPAPLVPPTKTPAASVPGAKGTGGRSAPEAAPPPSPGGAGPASPEVVAGDRGSYSLDPANPGGDGKSRSGGKKRPWPSFQSPVHVGELGLGGTGTPGGPQLNMTLQGAQAAVGNEKLKAERAADGAARRAAHRGPWEKNKFAKWRPAIENYEPSVTLDNTTSLNAAAQPFATYKVTIHNRIHPIFAEEDLAALDGLPKNHPLNDPKLYTVLEIVLDKDTGRIVRMGVTKPSGITSFDVQALDSVSRAGPFGKAPDIIASPDGNVYLHWEFHRDPVDACTTRNAFPYILKYAPKKPVKPVGPTPKPGASASDDHTPGPLLPLRER